MAKEIERKYIVVNDSYKELSESRHHIVQGYLSTDPCATVRVRIYDDLGYLTVKGLNTGASRDEWEYPVPAEDARDMLRLCGDKVIDKTRWLVTADNGLTWEVDEFHGRHKGLTIAEIELPEETTDVPEAPFTGTEVTGKPEYYNSSLAGL